MSGKPLTHAERGRLGGMKAAQQMTPEQRSYRAYQGAAGLSARLAERGGAAAVPHGPAFAAGQREKGSAVSDPERQRWRAPIAE